MDMSCSLDVLVRQEIHTPVPTVRADPMEEVVRQTREKIAGAFTGKIVIASRRKVA
jgi:hypothetical protein